MQGRPTEQNHYINYSLTLMTKKALLMTKILLP